MNSPDCVACVWQPRRGWRVLVSCSHPVQCNKYSGTLSAADCAIMRAGRCVCGVPTVALAALQMACRAMRHQSSPSTHSGLT